MHQDSLEPAAIQFTLEPLQESGRQSGYFLPAFFMYLYPQEPKKVTPAAHKFDMSFNNIAPSVSCDSCDIDVSLVRPVPIML